MPIPISGRAPWPELINLYASHVDDIRGKVELLELLRSSMARAGEQFQDVGELEMLQLIERFDGLPGTTLAWLHHGIAQEMYHRAQIVVYERLMGIEPALTRRIREAG